MSTESSVPIGANTSTPTSIAVIERTDVTATAYVDQIDESNNLPEAQCDVLPVPSALENTSNNPNRTGAAAAAEENQEAMTLTVVDSEATTADTMIAIQREEEVVEPGIEVIQAQLSSSEAIPVPLEEVPVGRPTGTGTVADITDVTTGLPLPLHDSTVTETGKRGGRYLGIGCDFATAAHITNTIYPISFVRAFIRWATALHVYHHDIRRLMERFFAIRMIFTAMATITAMIARYRLRQERSDNKWIIPLHLFVMTINVIAYLVQVAELERSFYDMEREKDDGRTSTIDYNNYYTLDQPYNYCLVIGFWLFNFYPNVCYMIESYCGYWDTPEDCARERNYQATGEANKSVISRIYKVGIVLCVVAVIILTLDQIVSKYGQNP